MLKKFKLRDLAAEDEKGNITGKIDITEAGIGIRLDGYATANSEDGQDDIVWLDLYEGKLRVAIWADINQEDCSHDIDLAGAKIGQQPPAKAGGLKLAARPPLRKDN